MSGLSFNKYSCGKRKKKRGRKKMKIQGHPGNILKSKKKGFFYKRYFSLDTFLCFYFLPKILK